MAKTIYSKPSFEEILICTGEALCVGSIPGFEDGSGDGQNWDKDPDD